MASRHRTHYGADAQPACRQKKKLLLPLAVSATWDDVTCKRCLTHRPLPAKRSLWSRFISWMERQTHHA